MPDNLTADQRHRAMSRVKQQDTDIEMVVRSALHRQGYRFRKHVKGLPGRPDIVFTRARLAVFLDGDFWHGFDFTNRKASLSDFWREKIRSNIRRDEEVESRLRATGWRVLRIWQHEIKSDAAGVTARIASEYALALESARSYP